MLVACEESQRVCSAFRMLGHEAYSCDIIEPSGGHPEWHIKGDALFLLKKTEFATMDGIIHKVDEWDLIVAHPPCTFISNAGACRLYPRKGELNQERYKKGLKAKEFFMSFLECDCPYVVVENPIPSKIFDLPPYSQIIQPYEFGHPYSKKTCLWLKGLPLLKPTKIIEDYKPYVSCGTSHNKGNKDKAGVSRAGGASKIRSKTFTGIAEAIAKQYSEYIERMKNENT